MATKDRVTIELYVDDQGTVKIRSVKKELEELGAAGKKGFGDAGASADEFAAALMRQVGLFALVGGLAHKLGSTLAQAFVSGIKAMDTFQQQTISIAASLTNIAESGQGSFGEMFSKNLSFSKSMYEEMRKEDSKRFASLDDLMTGYNALVQKGYAVRLNEVNSLGVLVDRIKLATVGQSTSLQINQEIRALMDGQARAGSLLAMELQSRIGPGWEDVVTKHKEAGTLLEYLAGLYPGISAASQEIEKTLEAQSTTLEGNLKYVGREGLGGAYEYIVDQMREINEYLRVHGKQISGDISSGWQNVRGLIQMVSNGIVVIMSDVAKLASMLAKVSGFIFPFKETIKPGGGGGGWGSEPSDPKIALEAPAQTTPKKMQLAAGGGGGGGKGKGGGGDGGLQSSMDRMLTIVDGLERELARISEGSLAEIGAWEKQQIDSIEKVARKGADSAQALTLVEKVKHAKIQKLDEDYEKWVAGAISDRQAAINQEEQNYLKKYRGFKEKEKEIREVFATKREEAEISSANELLGIYQEQFSKMQELTNIGFPKQMAYAKGVLDLEDERLKNSTRLLFIQGKITEEQFQQLTQMRQLVTQSKRQEKAWQGEGFMGGLKSGSKDMVTGGRTASYDKGRSALAGAERLVSSTISKGIVGALKGEKTSIADIGWDLGETAIQAMVELAVSQLFVMLAQGILTSSIPLVVAGATSALELEAGAAAAGATLIGAATTAAGILASVKVFGAFHGGGIVAHSGLIVAHNGLRLGSDERMVKAQVGEWIINRRAASSLASQGVNFNALNSGRVPGGTVRHTGSITLLSPEGRTLGKREINQVLDFIEKPIVRRERNLGRK